MVREIFQVFFQRSQINPSINSWWVGNERHLFIRAFNSRSTLLWPLSPALSYGWFDFQCATDALLTTIGRDPML